MCSYSGDIEFRAFLVELLVWSFNADGLDGGKANGSCFIRGTVNIFDGEWVFQGSKREFVFLGKGGVDNHSFSTTIKEGGGTDFLLRLSSDEEYSECDRRSSYILYSSFRYRLRV
jgi:hypothetical protein